MQTTLDDKLNRTWRRIRVASERGDIQARRTELREMDLLLDEKLDAAKLVSK